MQEQIAKKIDQHYGAIEENIDRRASARFLRNDSEELAHFTGMIEYHQARVRFLRALPEYSGK